MPVQKLIHFVNLLVSGEADREKLVLQAAVLRRALGKEVSSASEEDQRECIVQERR